MGEPQLTNGQRNCGFVGIRLDLHGVHNGPDGVESLVGHDRGLHRPSGLPTFGFPQR